jgi:HAMP domain-containing protein
MSLARRGWGNLPLAIKIAGLSSILVILIVPVLTQLTIQREEQDFRGELQRQASLLVDTLSGRLGDALYKGKVDEVQELAWEIQQHDELTQFRAYDENGELQADANQPGAAFPTTEEPIDPALLLLANGETRIVKDDQAELVLARGVWIMGEPVGVVVMGFSKAPLHERIGLLRMWSIGLAAAALVVGLLLATVVALRLSAPIRELTRTANRMAAGNLGTRFRPEGSDEIGQLGRAFNNMADAIELREKDLRQLASGLEQAVKERTGELQQQNQYLAALNEVTLGLIENLDVDRLLEAILVRAATLANTENAFIDVVNPERGQKQLRLAKGRYRSHLGMWTKLGQGLAGQVAASGQMKIAEDYQQFEDRLADFDWLRTAIYVPLRSENTVLGVIGLGYESIVPVKQDYVAILNQFAALASLAVRNAQLYSAAQQEIAQEVMRREAYRNSPRGRAEILEAALLEYPDNALVLLHEMAQGAGQGESAAILQELPGILESSGHLMLARLAEGYDFLIRSQAEAELLPVGLRHLQSGLEMAEARSLLHRGEAASMYSICQRALAATSLRAMTELLPVMQVVQAENGGVKLLSGLAGSLKELALVLQSLHAYERVDTAQDQRAYLVSAVERLSHADRVARGLGPADGCIIRAIFARWLKLVTGSMSDLQTRAQIACRLLTRHTWEGPVLTLALRLRNEGQGMALNLRMKLADSPDYDAVGEAAAIEHLDTGEETHVELRVRPRQIPQRGMLRTRFILFYDDPRGPNQVDYFADVVELMAPLPFQLVPNPYVAGTPLEAGSPLFFGREDLFGFISENLHAAHRNNLVLIGQRRTGKSSLLKQLPLRLGDQFLPVYLDGQSIALDPGMAAFFLNLATEIGAALKEQGFSVPGRELRDFAAHPAHSFEHEYLPRIRRSIGNRHLVLLLDEFEELESAVKRGNLEASVFGFLRHLIQHEPQLSVIFCGTHRLEELATDYWSVLFNISLYRHVGFLAYEEGMRLIQEPVAPYGMRYDDLALDKMWRITAGHPYFLQLLCHSLVNQHNREGRSYITVSDVNAALDEILSSGEAHFIYLWNESGMAERQALTVLSRLMTLTGHVTSVQVQDCLAERGIAMERHTVAETLHHLALRDILSVQLDSQPAGKAGAYSWRLGLLGMWIEKYKSLSMVQEEAQP